LSLFVIAPRTFFITSTLAVLLTIYSAVYSVIVAVSTTALYLAYAIPIYLNVRNRMRKQSEFATPETAPWSLKGWGTILNWISVAWIIFITILFSIPPNELAGWSMIILVVFMFFYWQLDAKNRFKGPTTADEAELRRIEAQMAEGDD